MLKSIGLLVASTSWLISSHAWADCRISSKEIQSQITRDGAKQALQELFYDSSGKWYTLMDCITTGENDWLKISGELEEYSDAGSSEDLGAYTAKALSNNAENVLRGGKLFKLRFSCEELQNDVPSITTQMELDKWYIDDLNKRLIGLNHIHARDLAADVAMCRNEINDEIKSLKEDITSQTKSN
jgi:hypothetical protein